MEYSACEIEKRGGGQKKPQTFDLYNAENISNNMAYRTIT